VRVPDEPYHAIQPLLAISRRRLAALSTPWGKRGIWYEAWEHGRPERERCTITAEICPRITPEFLNNVRASLLPLFFASEYGCGFVDTLDRVFRTEDFDRAFSVDVTPLFGGVRV
jgi:hypothetical protein